MAREPREANGHVSVGLMHLGRDSKPSGTQAACDTWLRLLSTLRCSTESATQPFPGHEGQFLGGDGLCRGVASAALAQGSLEAPHQVLRLSAPLNTSFKSSGAASERPETS